MTIPNAPLAAESSEKDFKEWLSSENGGSCVMVKFFPEQFFGAVKPLLFHWTLIFGAVGNYQEYENNWCYATESQAIKALKEWDGHGDPDGWRRNPKTGRRRPDGDASKEYVA